MRKIERQEKDTQRFENASLDSYEMWKLQIKERKELFSKVHERDIVNSYVEEESKALDPVEGTRILSSRLMLVTFLFIYSCLSLRLSVELLVVARLH